MLASSSYRLQGVGTTDTAHKAEYRHIGSFASYIPRRHCLLKSDGSWEVFRVLNGLRFLRLLATLDQQCWFERW